MSKLLAGIFTMYEQTNAANICLTGGEPFLQKSDEVEELCARLFDGFEFDVEVFTNGTIEWPTAMLDYVGFVCDWKLNGSGENAYDETRIKNVQAMYSSNSPGIHAIKFTVADESDLMQAVNIVKTHNLYDSIQGVEQPRIYAGVVWGKEYTTAKLVGDMIRLRLDWRLNVQLHNYIWDPQERGR